MYATNHPKLKDSSKCNRFLLKKLFCLGFNFDQSTIKIETIYVYMMQIKTFCYLLFPSSYN